MRDEAGDRLRHSDRDGGTRREPPCRFRAGARTVQYSLLRECHSVNGKGGSIGPELGRVVDRGFTPATLAATMWNHAPAMWAAMRQQDIRAGDLNEQAAADLFAYFYSARFFESPGDAARGKRAFNVRG